MIINNSFIFISLFILLLLLATIVILYYIYRSYTIYKNNMDYNLSLSEDNVNETHIALNKLQQEVNNKLNDVNNNSNRIIKNEPLKFNILNSNLNTLFNVNNNNTNFNDFINSNLSKDNINIKMNSKITNFSEITNLTDNNNYFKICNNSIDIKSRKCINLNVDNSGNFNIYPGLDNNSSNVSSLSIFNTNKNVLAKFDLNSNIISLGSDSKPAILINNNIYTPNIIVCNYTFNMATSSEPAKITLNYISNYNLQYQTYLNFMINTNYNFNLSSQQPSNFYINTSKINYSNNILKMFINTQIPANSIIVLTLNIEANDINYPIYNQTTPTTTNGYLTLS